MRAKELRKQIVDMVLAGPPAEPRCPHAHECGGCAFQDRAYAEQVAAKRAALAALYGAAGIDAAGLEVVVSPDPYAYRTRMDYVATKGRFGLRARGKFNYIIDLSTCHLIPPAAYAAAQAVWRRAGELGLPDYNIRSHAGFLRYVVVRRSPADELLIAAVTAAAGAGSGQAADDEAALEALAATALGQPGVVGFHWLINDTLTDLSFGVARRHWGLAELPMRVGGQSLLVGPNTFFQNNVHLIERLIDDVVAAAATPAPAAVADLYGGVGTLALRLAAGAASVACVEEVAESAALAARNSALNGIGNVQIVAQDVLGYLRGQPAGAIAVAVADPPRVGLGPAVCAELRRVGPERIVYVSCNPLTQVADLAELAAGYELVALRGYDMFPHTPHVEALAVLERRA